MSSSTPQWRSSAARNARASRGASGVLHRRPAVQHLLERVVGVTGAAGAHLVQRRRGTPGQALELLTLLGSELLRPVVEQEQPSEPGARAQQRDDRGRDVARRCLLLGQPGPALLQRGERGQDRAACADHIVERHIVVGVDVAPVQLGRRPLAAADRAEAQPPPATLGQRHRHPRDVREGHQVCHHCAHHVVDDDGTLDLDLEVGHRGLGVGHGARLATRTIPPTGSSSPSSGPFVPLARPSRTPREPGREPGRPGGSAA